MEFKTWVYNQVLAEPCAEFNRIESNIEEIISGLWWVEWPVMTHKTDRTIEHLFTDAEINNLEYNADQIIQRYHLPYNIKSWPSVYTHTDINRWERVARDMKWLYDRGDQLEYCGTFNCGQGGLI